MNTSNKNVFPVSKELPINWAIAKCKYSGFVNGLTSRTIPYKMTIDEKTPLIRDFTCYPDKVAAVATTNTAGVISQRLEEHHPFVSGVASFTTGTLEEKIYPRQIFFGDGTNLVVDEAQIDNPKVPAQWPCDNTGQILIKGVSYRINFRK